MVCIHNIDVELKKDKSNIRELKYSMNSAQATEQVTTSDNLSSVLDLYGSRLHDILVFRDGHHARLGNHSVINACRFLVGRSTMRRDLTRYRSRPRVSSGRRVEKLSIMDYRRNIKEHELGEKKIKIRTC